MATVMVRRGFDINHLLSSINLNLSWSNMGAMFLYSQKLFACGDKR